MSFGSNQAKMLTIEEQIKVLQEKKKKELRKLENSVGKKFIKTFDLQYEHIHDINILIDQLKELYMDSTKSEKLEEVKHEV
ncbi:hypothetical protein [Virgibacillus sp.]|uniref:hypothetical protein n=1 Tax=Virgibacillus sp. TaxID=1872700 RepID=UPI0017DA0D31|nr:hypothetical protein [Virgibacillus sp.]NWO12684.1 hypothetical protein [Virgibacillus sp.]